MTSIFCRSSSDESDLPFLKKRKTMDTRLVFLYYCRICNITGIFSTRNEMLAASDSEIGSTTPVKRYTPVRRHARVTSDSEISSPVKRFEAI